MTKKHALLLSASIAFAAFAGCTNVQMDSAGQMVAVYQFGQFRMLVNAQCPATAKAAEKAVQQLELFKTSVVVNKYEAQVLARARNDQRVTIDIKEDNSRQSLVSIRWGEGGDLKKSRILFEAIDANLK
jgi:hypothetical protein